MTVALVVLCIGSIIVSALWSDLDELQERVDNLEKKLKSLTENNP